jgi:hypothetical protein
MVTVYILWHIDPLLCSDSTNKRFDKHVPAAMNTHATIELLLKMMCFYVDRAETL